MFNKLYIIVERASVKSLMFWKFSGGDVVIMGFGFLVFFAIGRGLFDELVGLVLGLGIFIIIGFLLVEMPNHLSILEHIKKCYRYYFKTPKAYYYIPKDVRTTRSTNVDEEEEDPEWIEFQNRMKGASLREK